MLKTQYEVLSQVRTLNKVKYYQIQDIFMTKKKVTKSELVEYVREGLISNAYIFNDELLVFKFMRNNSLSYGLASNFVKQELSKPILENVILLEKEYENLDLKGKLMGAGTRVSYKGDSKGGYELEGLLPVGRQDLEIPEFITKIPFDVSYSVQKKLKYMCERQERKNIDGMSVSIGSYTDGVPMEALCGNYHTVSLLGTQSCLLSSFVDIEEGKGYKDTCYIEVSDSMNYIGKEVFSGLDRWVTLKGTSGLRVLYHSSNLKNIEIYDTTLIPVDTSNNSVANVVRKRYTKSNREALLRFMKYIESNYLSCLVTQSSVEVTESGTVVLTCRDKKQQKILSSLLEECYTVTSEEDGLNLLLTRAQKSSYMGAKADLLGYLGMMIEEFMLEYSYAVSI